MMVKILTLTGDELEMNVETSDTIQSVKDKLEEREGIPVDQQRLIYQGKKMRDDQTIKFYKIQPGTTLHLVIALRGGLKYAEAESRKSFYQKFVEPACKRNPCNDFNNNSSASTM